MSENEISYFAYGANMSARHLKGLGIKWNGIDCAFIENYELVFNKVSRDKTKTYANIQPKKGECVHGILYEGISQDDLDKLSHKEGVQQGHYKLEVMKVRILAFKGILNAYVYVASGKSITDDKNIKPSKVYMDKLWDAKDFLPLDYRNMLIQTEVKEGGKYQTYLPKELN